MGLKPGREGADAVAGPAMAPAPNLDEGAIP